MRLLLFEYRSLLLINPSYHNGDFFSRTFWKEFLLCRKKKKQIKKRTYVWKWGGGGGNSSLASDVIAEAKRRVFDAESLLNDIQNASYKGCMAVNALLDKYEYAYEPNPYDAIKYSNGVDKCDHAQQSWSYIYGYKEIMWLANVARDYFCSVDDMIEKFLNEKGGDLA